MPFPSIGLKVAACCSPLVGALALYFGTHIEGKNPTMPFEGRPAIQISAQRILLQPLVQLIQAEERTGVMGPPLAGESAEFPFQPLT